jgi:hypothetical protein
LTRLTVDEIKDQIDKLPAVPPSACTRNAWRAATSRALT